MKINTAELASGRMVRGSSSLSIVGNDIYSYRTQIAEIDLSIPSNPILRIDTTKYSRTTSKQSTWLKRYYKRIGYAVIDWNTGESI